MRFSTRNVLRIVRGCLCAFVWVANFGESQTAAAQTSQPAAPLTRLFQEDTYAQYALLEPNTGEFRVTFLAEESPVGSSRFDWRAFEGRPLPEAIASGLGLGATEAYDPRTGGALKVTYGPPGDRDVVRVALPRPVPEGGIGRVLIEQVFHDARSYAGQGDEVTWVRAFSAYRLGLVLPKGYSLVSSNVAAQVTTLPDGRLKLGFANPSGQGMTLSVQARKTSAAFVPVSNRDIFFDDVKTLYDLDAPETHTIRVEQRYSDFRKGSEARLDCLSYLPLNDLNVIDLDTAEPLQTRRTGSATMALLKVPIASDKQSAHLKITGLLQDVGYRLEDGGLVFDRTLRGLRNTVLLPQGWEVSAVSQSGTIGSYRGRAFVAFVNLNSENSFQVAIRARKRGNR